MTLELYEAICGIGGETATGARFFCGVAWSLDCEASALIVFEKANELLQAHCA